MMKKVLLVLILAAFVGGTAAPILSSFLRLGPATAYAGPKQPVEDDQGEDNDDQGEDEQ